MTDNVKVKIKGKGKKKSSVKWLQRQLNDPYVKKAHDKGYRCRAAFKLIEIDDKFKILKPNHTVVDLGSAPGGWSEIAVKKVGRDNVYAIDLLDMEEIPGVIFKQGDFLSDEIYNWLIEKTKSGVDVVLSDIAPNTTGNKTTDHLRIMTILEEAYYFAKQVLKPDGSFVAKVFQGGALNELLNELKKDFKTVKHFKPDSSRKESKEVYLIASGFKK